MLGHRGLCRSGLLLSTLLLALPACDDRTQSPSADADTSPADAPAQTCAGHRVGDACMTEENFADCQARERECPGEVVSLESCPLQFACP